jgi:hypothetical protein
MEARLYTSRNSNVHIQSSSQDTVKTISEIGRWEAAMEGGHCMGWGAQRTRIEYAESTWMMRES